MAGNTVSALTDALVNILIGSFSIVVLTWAAVGIQTLFNDRKDEKRKEASEARDLEYHEKRMKELDRK